MPDGLNAPDAAVPQKARLGLLGFGFVGEATAHALTPVADVAWHDPAKVGSRPLEDLLRWAEVLCICVPTPQGEGGAADLRFVREVVASIADQRPGCPTLLRSTVPPGTTEALVQEFPEVPLVFIPEFLRQRCHLRDAAAPSRVVLGWSSAVSPALRVPVRALFARRFPEVPRLEMSAVDAELLKVAANALFGVKVSFANEMHELAQRVGADWGTVRDGLVLDPRIGDGHLSVPGPDGAFGFGGACLPKDMAGLLALAASAGVELEVVAAAVRVNGRVRGR